MAAVGEFETLGKDGKGLPPASLPPVNNNIVTGDTVAENVPITDSEGLRRAYERDDGIYIYGDVAYIAGTKSGSDVLRGWPKIGMRDVENSPRYRDALAALEALPYKVRGIYGHSYGASVAQALGERFNIATRAYGTPSYTRGNWLERLGGKLVEPFVDSVAAGAGALAAEFGAPELSPFVMNASRDWLKNMASRLEGNLPKDTVPKYTVRIKRRFDPVGALDDKAKIWGDNRFNQHSSDGWNTMSNLDINAKCMFDDRFCDPVQRKKFTYRKNPQTGNMFFRR